VLLGILTFYNVVITFFNLLPAFPMDGGRILRAWLATTTNYLNATARAALVGKTFAVIFAIVGVLFTELPWLLLWLLIAFVIYTGAAEEEKSTTAYVTLEPLTVRDVMSTSVCTVAKDTSLEQLARLMLREKHLGYPVLDEAGVCVGMVTLEDLRKVAAEKRAGTCVGEVMSREPAVIQPWRSALDALRLLAEKNVGRLLVFDENNKLVGIVSRTDILRCIKILRS
jgi:CBS domain-containing protein